MQVQVFEAMDLVVHVGATDEGTAMSHVVLSVEQGDGVAGGIALEGLSVSRVVQSTTIGRPFEVAAEVAQGVRAEIGQVGNRRKGVGALCGIHPEGCANGICIRIVRLGEHSLTIEVQLQVVIQERRIQVDRCCVALKL